MATGFRDSFSMTALCFPRKACELVSGFLRKGATLSSGVVPQWVKEGWVFLSCHLAARVPLLLSVVSVSAPKAVGTQPYTHLFLFCI